MGLIPHLFEANHPIFLTFVTAERRPALGDPRIRDIIRVNLEFYRRKYKLSITAYAVMRDHLHLIIVPRVPHDVPRFTHDFKSFTAQQTNAANGTTGAFWQSGYWDRAIRGAENYRETVEYIHQNPLAYVDDLEDWPYVSYHNYHCRHSCWFEVDRMVV